MAKKMYIVRSAGAWHEPDASKVIGVFDTLAKAKAEFEGDWKPMTDAHREAFEYHNVDNAAYMWLLLIENDEDFHPSAVLMIIDVYEVNKNYDTDEE